MTIPPVVRCIRHVPENANALLMNEDAEERPQTLLMTVVQHGPYVAGLIS